MKQLNLFDDMESLSNKVVSKTEAKKANGFGSPTAIPYATFSQLKGIDRIPLWGNIFTSGDIIEVAGQQGVGKTNWLYKLILALATSGEFFGHSAPVPKSVLLLDGELPIDDINERFFKVCGNINNNQRQLLGQNLSIVNREFCGGLMPNICELSKSSELFKSMTEHDIVVIDSLKTNSFGSNISCADDVADLIKLFLELKSNGTTIIYVNHLTKNQAVLGSVDFDIINDVTIALSFDKKKGVDVRQFSILKGRSLSEQDKVPLHYTFEPSVAGVPFRFL